MNSYEIVFLIDSGIGNAIEGLYAVEYCLSQNIKTGIFLNKINASFVSYLRSCYGDEVILKSLENLETRHLIHSFTYQDKFTIPFEHYFYVAADYHSTKYKSETEQYLEIVKALYPSSFKSSILKYLKPDENDKLTKLEVQQKIIIYPGCSSINSARKWPHYNKLIHQLGNENCMIVGGTDDLKNDYSYIYPKSIARIFPQKILNNRKFWMLLKKIGLLKPHAHLDTKNLKNLYINAFGWGELVYIFKNCKQFIGNDGGLMHLAAASGAKGLAFFGPSCVEKNKPFNENIKILSLNYPCQPCQFGVGGVNLVKYFINCPYQVRCLSNLTLQKNIQL